MTTKNAAGFTIIEVSLFLAVSGILAAGILVSSSASIGQQRYRDSVASLRSVIQEQYSAVTNVVNSSRANSYSCNSTANVNQSEGGSTQRGQSDCLILGKIIRITDGKNISISDVLGVRPAGATPTTSTDSEYGILNSYTLKSTDVGSEESTVAWSATVVPESMSIAILRSPISSSILTFVSTSATDSVDNIVSSNYRYPQTDLCVSPEGVNDGGSQLAVRVMANATGPSAITIPSEDDVSCL